MLPPETVGCRIEALQFAPESRWEEALAVRADGDPESTKAWLARFCDRRLGVELFFKQPHTGGLRAFIGVRLDFSEDAGAAAVDISEMFVSRRLCTVGDFLSFTERGLGLPLFAGSPSFMELGLVNLWKSFGAVTFWRAGGAAPFEKFKDALSAEPRYLQKLPAPPAIETAYSEPVPHWLGIYVGSTLADGSCILDMDAAARCLKAEGSHPA